MTKPGGYDNKNNNFMKKNNNNINNSKPLPPMQSISTTNNRASLQSARTGRVVVTQVSSDVWDYENDWLVLRFRF
jgi:hypothetical protein